MQNLIQTTKYRWTAFNRFSVPKSFRMMSSLLVFCAKATPGAGPDSAAGQGKLAPGRTWQRSEGGSGAKVVQADPERRYLVASQPPRDTRVPVRPWGRPRATMSLRWYPVTT